MKLITFIALLLLGTSTWAAVERQKVGSIQHTIGKMYAVSSALGKRELTKNSPVYEGELLVTGKRTISKVRMDDGTFMILRPNTLLKVEEFSFGEDVKNPKGILSMIKGSMRAISGLMNKKRGGTLTLKTPTATIGVRGSLMTVSIFVNQTIAELLSKNSIVAVLDGDSINFDNKELRAATGKPTMELTNEEGDFTVKNNQTGEVTRVKPGTTITSTQSGNNVKKGGPKNPINDPVSQADLKSEQEKANNEKNSQASSNSQIKNQQEDKKQEDKKQELIQQVTKVKAGGGSGTSADTASKAKP